VADYPEVPHLKVPLELADDGSFAVVEQDTIDDVRQCVQVLLHTPLGIRPLAPDIGVEDPTFGMGVDPHALAAVLEEQEPRAAVTVLAAPVDPSGEQLLEVHVALAGDSTEEETT
jgi:phage baseplate assembly protein W